MERQLSSLSGGEYRRVLLARALLRDSDLLVLDEPVQQVDFAGQLGMHQLIARLQDELLNGEIFYTLKEAQVLIESWRHHYNVVRPHSSLEYRPPAPETIVMPRWLPGSATLRRPPSLAEKPAMH